MIQHAPRSVPHPLRHRLGAVASCALLLLVGLAGSTAARASASPRSLRDATIRLTATDPQFAYAIQVGDTITFRATVTVRGRSHPTGTVRFTADNPYDHGCPQVRLSRSGSATCYLAFYSPGRFRVTASYVGPRHARASVTLRFAVVPATND